MTSIENLSPSRCVSWYMMASYLYYQRNESIISDELYDQICEKIKRRIRKSDLKAGTGYTIKKYPAIVVSAAERWSAGEFE